jgi:hypothetical protein
MKPLRLVGLFLVLALTCTSCSDEAAPSDDNGSLADAGVDASTDADPEDGGIADTGPPPDADTPDADPSDADTADVDPPDAGDPDVGTPDSDASPDAGGDCPSTHPRVGWTAELTEQAHNGGGTAEIIDDCTVRITNFTYDGQGLEARIYGATGGDYANGYAMSDDLVRPQSYDGETLIARLPDDRTLDDLDGISVWCVPAGADFGSGEFSAP